MDELGTALAQTIQTAREARSMTVAELAETSGVSRAMISKVERGESQPTAALLSRLASAFGLTLSELIAHAEDRSQSLSRREEQPTWQDPATGYVRRAVSPPSATLLELVEVELPPGARVSYPAASFRSIDHQIWMLSGRLRFVEGDQTHDLDEGDCLQLGSPTDCTYINPTSESCRYLVVLGKNKRRAAEGRHRTW